METRKQEIKETIDRMRVWNCWDELVLEKVFARGPGESIDSVVRKFVSKRKNMSEKD